MKRSPGSCSYANLNVWSLERSDHLAAHDSIVQSPVVVLNFSEPDVSARLTLQIIEQSSEGDKLIAATLVEAMVSIVLVDW